MIINLPKKAIVDRIIPKDRFNFKDATKIGRIRWFAKLATNTINLPVKTIPEIEVFTIEMDEFDETILTIIKDKIPHSILFIVNDEWLGMVYQGKIYGRSFKQQIEINGLNLDEVQDNFIRQILNLPQNATKLGQQLSRYQQQQQLQQQIDSLNLKIKRTKQLNIKQALARERYGLEEQLKELGE